MLIGLVSGSVFARRSSHSPSPQSYDEVNTTDAVAGGVSVANAIGSAFCLHTPSRPSTSNL